MKTLYVDTEGGDAYKIVGDAVKKYLPKISGVEYKATNHKQTEIRHIDPFQPDWCLTSTPLNNHSYIIKQLRNWLSVGWDLEGVYDWRRLRTTDSPNFHVVATVDPTAQKLLTKAGHESLYLPLGFDPDVYNYQEVGDEYKCDVIMAGVMYENRARIIKALEPISKDIKIRTINCRHWEAKLIHYKKFIHYYHRDKIPVSELVKYYCGAKIILIGNRDFDPGNDQKHLGIKSQAIGRVFQETACKQLVLVDNTRPNLKDHFKIGEEIDVFNSDEELRSKILYYLKNEDEREAIAEAGYQRTMKENTYQHRMQTLVNYMNKNIHRIRKNFNL